ncbi:MAG: SWIM zinc finger family protein [Candidatus Eremiobacteraeota bacterium]|nr:SWIM zinc finger family protein [Candidatus Eremiobacteraeota bacterium]
MSFWGYSSASERRSYARQMAASLEKSGRKLEPVTIQGLKIARSFWGKAWCEHLESFSDIFNRLERGRTYARNGSVLHLAVTPGQIEALVSGGSLYDVRIRIDDLAPTLWQSIQEKCAGQVATMLELLQGQFSSQVMKVVTDRHQGLFPQPSQIHLKCSCPDGARMCKHVAAVLYGMGNRLDDQPELLFRLRGVDPAELFSTHLHLPQARDAEVLPDDGLADLFGIELLLDPEGLSP